MIIDLPRVGSADDPTPCRGDLRFTNARSAQTIRDCQALCATCRWRGDCHQLATAIQEQGYSILGVWAGKHYGGDNEGRHEHTNDRGRHGLGPMADHPPRVVRLAGPTTPRPGNGTDPGLPIPRQRNTEPW